MSDSYLQSLVIHKCRELGTQEAATFFEVSPALVRQWVNGSKTPSLAAVEKVFVRPESPPAEAGWADREVFLALPFYKSTSPLTLFSVLGMWDRTKFRAGVEFNNAFLTDAREKLAHEFLQTTCPWSFWVDDDIVFPFGHAGWFNRYAEMQLPERFAGLHAPTRLRSHNKSIVSGTYVERKQGGRVVYHEAMVDPAENARAHEAPIDELRPATWVPFGCVIVHRDVFAAVKEKHPFLAPESTSEVFHFFTKASDGVMRALPELKSKVQAATEQVQGGTHDAAIAILQDVVSQIDSAVTENTRTARLKQQEDQTFCARALVAGHQPFVDLGLVCAHLGTRAFNPQNTKS